MNERPIDNSLMEDIKLIIQHGDRAEIVPAKDDCVRLYVARRREFSRQKRK